MPIWRPARTWSARAGPSGSSSSAARLAHLSDSARAIVNLAATIGRTFTLDVLIQACSDVVDGLVGALDELRQRQIVREHGASGYDFSHD
jgi:predicted ATPase